MPSLAKGIDMDALTDVERRLLLWMAEATASGGWFTARRIADYSGVFQGRSNRSKAGAVTATLKRLHAAGHVEKDRTELPTVWRHRRS